MAIKKFTNFFQFALMVLLAFALADNVWGAAQTWTTGSGTWNTGANGWNGTTTWAAGDTASFAGGSDLNIYTITIGGAITTGVGTSSAGGVGFANSGYTLSASTARTITVGTTGTGFTTVGSGKSGTIGTNVSVLTSGAWNLNGGGTLNISGAGSVFGTSSLNSSTIGGGTTANVQSGGTMLCGNSIIVGDAGGATLNVTGGTVTIGNTGSSLILGNTASATYNAFIRMTSGAIAFTNLANTTGLRFGGGSSSATTHITGKFDLDGGILTVNKVFMGGGYTAGATYDATFNFNGGTLKALANNTLFMDSFSVIGGVGVTGRANIRNGGAIIDSNGKTVTIGQVLQHSNIGGDDATDGGLTLNDTAATKGTLTLNAAETYTGNTTISAGTLALGASASLNAGSSVNIAAGATFDVSAIAAYTWGGSAKLIANGSATAAATIKGGATGVDVSTRPVVLNFTPTSFLGDDAHPALTNASGTLNISGSTITVTNNGGTPLGAGDYTLMVVSGAGVISGTPTLDSSAGVGAGAGMAVGTAATLQYNGSSLVLHVVSSLTTTTTTIALNSPWTSTSTYGDALSFHVTVSGTSPTGTVTIKDGGTGGTTIGSGTLSGGAVDITLSPLNVLSATTHANIVAVYGGDSNNQGSSSTALASQTVNPKSLTVSGAVAYGKCYDGTTATVLVGTLAGIVGSDVVTLLGTGDFDNAGPGNGINVTSTSTLGGAAAANYTLTQPTGLSANIITTPAVWINPTNGIWDANTNWANNIIANASGNTADFSSLNLTNDITVSLASPRTIGNLVLGDTDTNTAAGWVLNNNGTAGNILTLAGSTPTVQVNGLGTNKVATISAIVTGLSGLTKTGNGTLALNGANTYSGGLFISNGIVNYNADNSLGAVPGSATPDNIVLDGGTLAQSGANLTINVNRGTTLGANGGTLANVGGGNMTYGGIIAGPGALTVNLISGGSGAILSGQSTYTGGSTFIGSASGNVYCVASSVGDPGSLVSGPFGTGTVTFNGPGTRSTTGADTTVGNAIVLAADVTFQSIASEKTLALGGPVTLSSNRTLTVNIGSTVVGKSLTFTNVISDGGNNYSLTKAGTGLMILTGASTYGGGTVVSAGKLQADNSAGSATGTGLVTVANGGTLAGIGTVGAVTVASGGVLAPGDTIGTLTVSSLTLNSGAVLNMEFTPGSGTPNDSITVSTSGGLNLNGGVINLYEVGTTIAPTVDGTYNLIAYSGTLNGNLNNLSIGNPVLGKSYLISTDGSNVKVTIGTAPTLNYWGVDSDGSWNSAPNWSLGSVPSGQFASASFGGPGSPVSFTAPHTVTLDASQTLGWLTLDSAQSFTINQGTGGSLTLDNGSAAAVVAETSGSHVINAPLTLASYGAAVTVATNTTLSMGSVISGTGGINKTAPGKLVLSGASTYSGVTTVSAGNLVVSNNAALGSTAGGTTTASGGAVELAHGIVIAGETITVNGAGSNARGALQAGNATTNEWSGPLLLGANAGNTYDTRVGAQPNGLLKLSGIISDGGGTNLTISADVANGRVIVSGTANNYSGLSQIVRGTLLLGANNALPVTTILDVHPSTSVADASVFDLAGFNQQVGGIRRGNTSGPALITNSVVGLATLTVSNSAAAYTYDSPIAGPVALVKTGTNTLTLSGTNAYTGNTTVNAGTLAIAQATLATNSTITVAGGAVLQLNFAVTNVVTAITLNGSSQPPGIYNSNSAAPYITGPGALQIVSTMANYPTNLTLTVSGNILNLTWPATHLGWYAQSNSVNLANSNFWHDVPGSQNVTNLQINMNPALTNVFYRLSNQSKP